MEVTKEAMVDNRPCKEDTAVQPNLAKEVTVDNQPCKDMAELPQLAKEVTEEPHLEAKEVTEIAEPQT